jgi:hypothetical protein
MSQRDLSQRATECADAIEKTRDPQRRAALVCLRKLWIALDDHKAFMTHRQLAEQIDDVSEVHAAFFGPDKSRLN